MNKQYNSDLVSEMARLGKPFCDEDNTRLYPLVAAGDADARREMIEGNMSLVVAKVDKFLAELPHLVHLRDDLTSAGFIGLVEAISNMQRRKVRNPTSYVSIAINRSFRQLLKSESPIHVPPESRRLAKAEGKEIEVPTVSNKAHDPCRLPLAPQVQEVEARNLLDSCCKDRMERRILRLRERGGTCKQIGERVGRHYVAVNRILNRVEADYYQRRGLRQREEQGEEDGKKRSKKRARA